MNPSEFDKFAKEYRDLHAANIAASGEEPEYFAEYKVRDLRRLCDNFNMGRSVRRILDFGAGIGNSVAHVRRYFPEATLSCVDVSLASLTIGVQRFGREAGFVAFNGRRLPFSDGSFDCVFAACVFHHIEPERQIPLLAELHRILRPGGVIAVFEHNPFNPLTVRAVRNCAFDENATLLRASTLKSRLAAAGFTHSGICYRIFFPRALKFLRPMEQWLRWLPLGAQYFAYDSR